jgi:hypothetical protein
VSYSTEDSRFRSITYSWPHNSGTYLADVNGIVVATATLGVRVDISRIFPCLWEASIVEKYVSLLELFHFKK